MHSGTVSVVIPAAISSVFHCLSESAYMSEWAIEFCQGMQQQDGVLRVLAPYGLTADSASYTR